MEILTMLDKYWAIGAAFIGIIISYTNLKSQNVEQEKRIITLETKCDTFNAGQTAIDIKLATIQSDIKWIKKSLGKDDASERQ